MPKLDLMAGLMQQIPLPEALRPGTAAGALATTQAGAASSIPERGAVRELCSMSYGFSAPARWRGAGR